MTHEKLWCGVLILALTVGLAVPARAANAEKVLIVVAATTLAAAITVVVTLSVHHRRKKIAVTGCVVSGEKGMSIAGEENSKTYFLSGNTAGIKPGDRMTVQGKQVKSSGRTLVWEVTVVIKDFGVCQQ